MNNYPDHSRRGNAAVAVLLTGVLVISAATLVLVYLIYERESPVVVPTWFSTGCLPLWQPAKKVCLWSILHNHLNRRA